MIVPRAQIKYAFSVDEKPVKKDRKIIWDRMPGQKGKGSKMMKQIYQITRKCSFGVGAEKLALLVNMLLWFLAGAVLALLFGLASGAGENGIKSYVAAVGSVASLLGGYIGGMLWLVNKEK